LKLRNDLANQSVRDPLTGMYIQRYLFESLAHEISRATRYKRSMGLIMIDIDNFHSISETMGHAAANAVLQALGKSLLSQIRSSDIGCRFEGSTFVILLSEASLEDTARRAEVLRMGGKNLRIMFGGHQLKSLTLSIGVAAYPQHGDTPDELVKTLEAAVNLAKNRGRDQVVTAELPQEK
jgi:diguanylate cyclase (GGDEF)-like protein